MNPSEFDAIVNQFTISGNEKVKKFIKKLNDEFIKGGNKSQTDHLVVRKILEKYFPETATYISDDASLKSVTYASLQRGESSDVCINFTSQEIINELQDRLLYNLIKLDPKVIVCNQHYDYYLSGECHTRYVLMNESALAEISVSTPIPKSNNQNEKFLIKFNQLMLNDKEKVLKLVKETYKS